MRGPLSSCHPKALSQGSGRACSKPAGQQKAFLPSLCLGRELAGESSLDEEGTPGCWHLGLDQGASPRQEFEDVSNRHLRPVNVTVAPAGRREAQNAWNSPQSHVS